MKHFLFFMLLLSSFCALPQGSTIGRSYASLYNELSQDNRVKIDYSYKGGSRSYLKVDFLTENAFKVHNFSNGYVNKEDLVIFDKTIQDWARIALGLQEEGWAIVSRKKDGEDSTIRLTKNNYNVLVVFSPSAQIVLIITTKS